MAVPPTVPLEAVIQLLPGTVAQPHSLQQHAVCPGLLLGGVQRLVFGGGGVPGRLLLPPLELPVNLVGVLGSGASAPHLHLPPAEGDASGHLGLLGGSPGGRVGSLIASYAHVAGYPVEVKSAAGGSHRGGAR